MIKLPLYPALPQAASLREKPLSQNDQCSRCTLSEDAQTVCMPAQGAPGGLLVIMDAPSRVDDQIGRGYRSAAGKYISELVQRWWKGPIALDYAIRCSPRVEVKDKHIEACRPYLAEVFYNAVRPKRVLTVGMTATSAFLGHRPPLLQARESFAFAFDQLDDPVPVFMIANPIHAMKNRLIRAEYERDLQWALESPDPDASDFDAVTNLVTTRAESRAAVKALRKAAWFSYDTETFDRMGNSTFRIEALSAWPAGQIEGYTWTRELLLSLDPKTELADLAQLLADKGVEKSAQNGKYDDRAVYSYLGAQVRGTRFDTRLGRKILDPDSSAKLEHLSYLVGQGGHKEEADAELASIRKELNRLANPPSALTPKGNARKIKPPAFDVEPHVLESIRAGEDPWAFAFGYIKPDILYRYNARDAFVTMRCTERLEARMAQTPQADRVWKTLTADASRAVKMMEHWGIRCDRSAVEHFSAYCQTQLTAACAVIDKYAPGLNPNSPKQVGDLLFNKLKLRSTKQTKTGALSTDGDVLESLQHKHPVVAALVKSRKYTKLDGTYARGMLIHIREDNRIHPSILIDGARCLPAGELVLTDRGYIPCEVVRVGDLVISHTGVMRKVTAAGPVGSRPIVKVTLSNGNQFRASADHPVMTQSGWVNAGDLTVGACVQVHSSAEDWRDIPEWPGYCVSSWGRVRSPFGRFLTPQRKGKWGHLKVTLARGKQDRAAGDAKDFAVHRLVAEAFLGAAEGREVRHLNGIAWDNTVENLKWGTAAENRADMVRHGTYQPTRKLTEAQVVEIRETPQPPHGGAGRWHGVTLGVSDSVLAKRYGVARETIRDVRSGKRWCSPTAEGVQAKFSWATVLRVERQAIERVYGATVEVDHSHVTHGVVTHNTGRFSCTDPNLQNIPRAEGGPEDVDAAMARNCFVSEDGWVLLELDYSQIELRVAAMLSGDPVMIADYKAGIDIHMNNATACATIVWHITREKWDTMTKKERAPYRSKIKTATFAKLYGKTLRALAREFNAPLEEVEKIDKAIWGRYKVLDRWTKEQISRARKTGYVDTWWDGQPALRRFIPSLGDPDEAMRQHGENEAVNTPVQGTAANFMSASLPRILDWITEESLPARLVLTVHDSVMLEVRKNYVSEVAHGCREIMLSHNSLGVPLEVEAKVGTAWGSMADFTFTK